MIKDKFGQIILEEDDIVNQLMSKKQIDYTRCLVKDITISNAVESIIEIPKFKQWRELSVDTVNFDTDQQSRWLMPEQYQKMDIAAYVLSLCKSDAELQRCGQELMMYQERNLFDLLKYLHYLVEIMKANNVIWGLGRGSSVASFVLYKLGLHRVDSLFYNLDPTEFLR